MPFAPPEGWWPPAPADAVLLAYVGFQALRGATRGGLATLVRAAAFVVALAVALSVAALRWRPPLPIGEQEAGLLLALGAFLVAHAVAARLIGLLCAPAALPLAVAPGGDLVERAAGLGAGAAYGAATAALGLALTQGYLPAAALSPWLDGAPLSAALSAAGAEGLTLVQAATAMVLTRLHARWAP
ncbi:MAG: hypothetical protein HYU88_13550 [Chloroflexi bacterium]|nr:hypothetical protein [Chloroflexota bacterium]MBI4505124.1 hypothetical protein [Chloroflexota bacterium]